MKIIVTENYEEMSWHAAGLLMSSHYGSRSRVNIAVTSGETPKRMYEMIAPHLAGQKEAFRHVHYYSFDEVPVRGEAYGITMTALQSLFFAPADIPGERIHPLPAEQYQECDERIRKAGGLDMIMMGLGADGHFCGVLPGTISSFDNETYYIPLKELPAVEKRVGRHFISCPEKMPDHYISFGPKSVMAARHLVVIVSGGEKAEALSRMLFAPITPELPASVFQLHPNLTVVADQAAVASCKDKIGPYL